MLAHDAHGGAVPKLVVTEGKLQFCSAWRCPSVVVRVSVAVFVAFSCRSTMRTLASGLGPRSRRALAARSFARRPARPSSSGPSRLGSGRRTTPWTMTARPPTSSCGWRSSRMPRGEAVGGARLGRPPLDLLRFKRWLWAHKDRDEDGDDVYTPSKQCKEDCANQGAPTYKDLLFLDQSVCTLAGPRVRVSW